MIIQSGHKKTPESNKSYVTQQGFRIFFFDYRSTNVNLPEVNPNFECFFLLLNLCGLKN